MNWEMWGIQPLAFWSRARGACASNVRRGRTSCRSRGSGTSADDRARPGARRGRHSRGRSGAFSPTWASLVGVGSAGGAPPRRRPSRGWVVQGV